MRYSVIYSSRTGNTEKLAQQIKDTLGDENCICYGAVHEIKGADKELADSDVVCIGSWTDKGTCDTEMQNFLSSLHEKKLFLFGTCGFGGSETYYQQILSRMKAYIPESCTLLGTYMCQGKMPESVRLRYEGMLKENPEDQKMKQMIENFDQAIKHPDEADLAALTNEIIKVIG